MELIDFADLNYWQWGILALGAAGIGLEKSGVKGMSMMVVPMYAITLGAKASSGLLLLLFLLADVFGMRQY